MAQHIAVIDIGKTNAKLALVEAGTLRELDVVTRPNTVRPGPPWPHFDLDGHWAFFLNTLAAFQSRHGVDAISVTTHGAAAVLLENSGALAVPMLDYEHDGPDTLAERYDALRPAFAETGSARLPKGLNLGAQLYWMMETYPGLRERTAQILTYPQYWGFLLAGNTACDLCSLGCHTDLWDPWQARFSPLVEELRLSGRFAPPRRPGETLGTLLPEIAARTGIAAGTPVSVGIHDSNASLLPYLRDRSGPFAVVSTGTWVVVMSIDGTPEALDPDRDVLVNVSAEGRSVPSARFMGGREYEILRAPGTAVPSAQDRQRLLAEGVMILPAAEPGSGPYRSRRMHWTAAPGGDGARMAALSWYLALMTDTCLSLVGARGPVIVEGPFARNDDYLAMLAALRPEGVELAASATGTSAGAALLAGDGTAPATRPTPHPAEAEALCAYAAAWRTAAAQG